MVVYQLQKIADSAVTLAKTTGLPFGKILQAVGEKLELQMV